MSEIGRRALLKGLAGVPAVAAAVAAQGPAMLGRSGLTAVGLAGGSVGREVGAVGGASAMKFADFASWFQKFGRAEVERRAKELDGFDADILSMRLPLATKVRMQRTRNYERILAERKADVEKRIGLNGFMEWWP